MGIFSRRTSPDALTASPANYLDAILALNASAERINLDNESEVSRVLRRREQWQDLAWSYFDAVGEIKQTLNVVADVVSKVRLYVGTVPTMKERTDDPTIIPNPTNDERANMVLAALSPSGDYSSLLSEHFISFRVAGECYLIGFPPDPTTNTPEVWDIFSSDELRSDGGRGFEIVEDIGQPVGSGRKITSRDFMLRMWLKHPRFSRRSDSPLRGVLSSAENLLIIERTKRALLRSRIPAGIQKIPNEMLPPSVNQSDAPTNADPGNNPMIRAMKSYMSRAVRDEGSAASVVPFFVNGPKDVLDAFTHMPFERPFDDQLDIWEERELRRLAQGLPAPPEIVLSMENISGWSGYLLVAETFATHAEPTLRRMLADWTSGYMRPRLVTLGMSPAEAAKFCVWYDASQVVSDPNGARDTTAAYTADLISGRSARKRLGYKEVDAPDDKELLQKVALRRGNVDPTIEGQLLNDAFGIDNPYDPALVTDPNNTNSPPTSDAITHDPAQNGGRRPTKSSPASSTSIIPPAERPPPPSRSPRKDGQNSRPMTAAAETVLADAAELSMPTIDPRAYQLQGAAETAIQYALEKSGNRVIQRATTGKYASKGLVASLKDIPKHAMAACIGPTQVESLGYDAETLLADAFTNLLASPPLNTLPDKARSAFISSVSALAATRLFTPTGSRTPSCIPLSICTEAIDALNQ